MKYFKGDFWMNGWGFKNNGMLFASLLLYHKVGLLKPPIKQLNYKNLIKTDFTSNYQMSEKFVVVLIVTVEC